MALPGDLQITCAAAPVGVLLPPPALNAVSHGVAMRFLSVVAVLMAVGCGSGEPEPEPTPRPPPVETPREFEGIWSGVLYQNIQCANGNTGVREFNIRFDVTQSGSNVRLLGNTSCGTISATASGTRATLHPASCKPIAVYTYEYTDAIEGGRLDVIGNSMQVNAQLSTVIRAATGQTLSCIGPMTGTLRRME